MNHASTHDATTRSPEPVPRTAPATSHVHRPVAGATESGGERGDSLGPARTGDRAGGAAQEIVIRYRTILRCSLQTERDR